MMLQSLEMLPPAGSSCTCPPTCSTRTTSPPADEGGAPLAQGTLAARTALPIRFATSQWKNGPSGDPNYFPLAVWLQDPRNAGKFKALGINTYVGLWQGPTEGQLAELARQGMARSIPVKAGGFRDDFEPCAVHLYRLIAAP